MNKEKELLEERTISSNSINQASIIVNTQLHGLKKKKKKEEKEEEAEAESIRLRGESRYLSAQTSKSHSHSLS